MSKKRALVVIPLVLLVGAAALALVLGQRSRGLTAPADTGGSSAGSLAGGAEPAVGDTSGAQAKGADSTSRAAVEPLSRAVISTGQLTLHSKDLAKARAEALRLVSSWNGSVADEESSSDRHGRISDTTMTLRVPSARFDEAMTTLAGLGTVEQQSRTSEDVTTKVIDHEARVRAAERSIQQIEVLLSRARQMSDIIAIESDLARRQADLDSLKSQQAWLEDQTSLSTINLYLGGSGALPPPDHEARGFLDGLEGGWSALENGTVLLLTGVGAVIPFALVLGLLGVPLWLVVRRRVSAGSTPARTG